MRAEGPNGAGRRPTGADRFAADAVAALRVLGRLWLLELRAEDVSAIATFPELRIALGEGPAGAGADEERLLALAIEHQRLFGMGLPPFESVFLDPSARLMAPATARVAALYAEAGWTPPPAVRAAAPDHLGAELLALADLATARPSLAQRLHTRHLALWAPVCVLGLGACRPDPFYAALGDLTLRLLLGTLTPDPLPEGEDPFPDLPPPPVYRGTGLALPAAQPADSPRRPSPAPGEVPELSLSAVLDQLLTPCRAGLFLTREDLLGIARGLDLPTGFGERRRALGGLFAAAGEADRLVPLLDRLDRRWAAAGAIIEAWLSEWPAAQPYAAAWLARLGATRAAIAAWRAQAADLDAAPGGDPPAHGGASGSGLALGSGEA